MIKSFACKETEKLFHRVNVKKFGPIQHAARRKLEMLHAARSIQDLNTPPGNRLEQLKGNRQGQYSIRINGQWRICFIWNQGECSHVEIVDYH